jgi:hypothetical protein
VLSATDEWSVGGYEGSPFTVTVAAGLGVDDVEAGLTRKVLQVLYPDPSKLKCPGSLLRSLSRTEIGMVITGTGINGRAAGRLGAVSRTLQLGARRERARFQVPALVPGIILSRGGEEVLAMGEAARGG